MHIGADLCQLLVRNVGLDERDVEQALVRLLTMYSAVSRSLSEWEQYCLSSALVFERTLFRKGADKNWRGIGAPYPTTTVSQAAANHA